MRKLLTEIALVAFLVLSLFLLVLRVYQQNHVVRDSTEKVQQQQQNTKNDNQKINLKTILKEQNKTLDQQYKAIASEIEDFRSSEKFQKIKEKKALKTEKFTSKCTIAYTLEKPLPKPRIIQQKEKEEPVKKIQKSLPLVAIIMDDVSSKWQAKLIKKLPFPITPSIFPATYDHPNTPEIAKMFQHYMVHTPMEAYHFPSPEENTLHVDDSLKTIDMRIKNIKKDFPHLIAINNHTGSMFTSDYESMDKLFCVLKKYHIRFVDSRTSAQTKGTKMGKIFHTKVLERNVFLDNIDDEDAILDKLKETVSYAKKNHLAIAICHPKESTFQALMHAKNILHGVEVVTIDKLY